MARCGTNLFWCIDCRCSSVVQALCPSLPSAVCRALPHWWDAIKQHMVSTQGRRLHRVQVMLRVTAFLSGRCHILQVYRGLRGGVQDIAVKVLHASDEAQTRAFRKVFECRDLGFYAPLGDCSLWNCSNPLSVCVHSSRCVTCHLSGLRLQMAASTCAPGFTCRDCCAAGDQHPEVDQL